MATLTAAQLADMQADLAITNDESVFLDSELQRIYDRAGGNYARAITIAIRQLLMNATKFNDYSAGQTTERKQQIFQNLQGMYKVWEDEWRSTSNQVRIVGARPVPPVVTEYPYTEELPDAKRIRNNQSLVPRRPR